jgi:hypothetical protein
MHCKQNRTLYLLTNILMAAKRLCARVMCHVMNGKHSFTVLIAYTSNIHVAMYRLVRAATKNAARCAFSRELLQSATRFVF